MIICYWPNPVVPKESYSYTDTSEAKKRYGELSREQKTDFLVQLSHAITIVGRECYEVGGTGLDHPKSLRAVNEIQHRIMGAIMELRGDDASRDWIIELVLAQEDPLLSARARWAFDSSITSATMG